MEVGHACATLGVRPGSSPEVLRSAYRVALRRHHPDAAGSGDPLALAAVRSAYRTLSVDAARRASVRRVASASPQHIDVYA